MTRVYYNETRQGDNAIGAALEWKPQEKSPRGRPRKRWINVVEEDLQKLRVNDWINMVQDVDRWRDVLLAVKTLLSCKGQNKKKVKHNIYCKFLTETFLR